MALPGVAADFEVSRVLSSEAYRSPLSRTNGMVVAEFVVCFQESLMTIGYESMAARALRIRSLA